MSMLREMCTYIKQPSAYLQMSDEAYPFLPFSPVKPDQRPAEGLSRSSEPASQPSQPHAPGDEPLRCCWLHVEDAMLQYQFLHCQLILLMLGATFPHW